MRLHTDRMAAIFALALMLFSGHLVGQTTYTLQIVDRPLTASCSGERNPNSVIDTIMLHFISEVAENKTNPYSLEGIIGIFEKYEISAHYLIDRQGKVFRLVDEKRAAYHAGLGMLDWKPERKNLLNHFSIGIEMMAMGTQEEMKPYLTEDEYKTMQAAHPEWFGYTGAQYAAVAALISDIRSRHPLILHDRQHIVGHEEYAKTRRTDPGQLFDYQRINLQR